VIATDVEIVPFHRPYLTGREEAYLAQSLASGALAGDGPFTARASALVAGLAGGEAALLTPSCTHALELAALLLELTPGDEVIVPSFTFPSTASAFALRGAVPVFVDCLPETLSLDPGKVAAAVTDRTRAIVVVHYGGVAAEMTAISEVARDHGLVVVEDNAHGLGGTYQGRPLGSLGAMATQSFHATKNIQCGEGGALVFTDQRLVERAEILREKGTNRAQFFRGMVDKYRWVEVGSSLLLADPLAAILTAQLEEFTTIHQRRHAVWDAYQVRLADWATAHGVVQPTVPEGCTHPAHLYYLLLPGLEHQRGLIAHLKGRGVQATFHYQPLHTAPAGLRHGRVAPGGCEVAERVAESLVRLPLFAAMTEEEVDRVITGVLSYKVRA
jgi:dTDP-4-amino-4,6-dideoxygalactose transaminase